MFNYALMSSAFPFYSVIIFNLSLTTNVFLALIYLIVSTIVLFHSCFKRKHSEIIKIKVMSVNMTH